MKLQRITVREYNYIFIVIKVLGPASKNYIAFNFKDYYFHLN
jgi:hypothetical protein